jgi:hypothetical protein
VEKCAISGKNPKKEEYMLKIAVIVGLLLFGSGCGIALVTAAAGYTASSIGKKNTEQKQAYDNYKMEMEKMNLEREKNHLEPRQIATFDEWNNGKR